MRNTYQSLLKLEELYEGNREYTNESLVEATNVYKQTHSPESFAFIYCRIFKITLSVAKKYSYLTEEEKGSHSTEVLHTALKNYKNNNGSVQYYYSHCLSNRLLNESNKYEAAKRSAHREAQSYEDVSILFEGEMDDELSKVELIGFIEKLGLNSTELSYCREIINHSCQIRNTDIAHKLGISSPAVHEMKHRLKKKLAQFANSF